jgi:hypothetical protein
VLRRQRLGLAVDVDDGERLAPVALAAEQPVAQLVVHLRAAQPLLLQPGGDLLLGGRRGQAVEQRRVDGDAVAREPDRLDAGRGLHHHDRQVELLRELVVALSCAGHGHDRAGAVGRQHVVGDPDRDGSPLTGLTAYAPVKTPVFSFCSSVRSRSLLRAAAAW